MKKLVFFATTMLIVFILSGCSANEKIVIDKDKSSETINVSDDNVNFSKYETPITDTVYELFRPYKEELIYNDYKYDIFTKFEDSGITITKEYDDICKLINSSVILKKLYNSYSCNETNKYYEIKSNGNLLTNGSLDDQYILDSIDEFELSIESKFEVEDSNSDLVNGNVHTWKFSKNNPNKILNIKIKKDSIIKKHASLFTIIISIITFVIICLIIGIILYKKNRRNKIIY